MKWLYYLHLLIVLATYNLTNIVRNSLTMFLPFGFILCQFLIILLYCQTQHFTYFTYFTYLLFLFYKKKKLNYQAMLPITIETKKNMFICFPFFSRYYQQQQQPTFEKIKDVLQSSSKIQSYVIYDENSAVDFAQLFSCDEQNEKASYIVAVQLVKSQDNLLEDRIVLTQSKCANNGFDKLQYFMRQCDQLLSVHHIITAINDFYHLPSFKSQSHENEQISINENVYFDQKNQSEESLELINELPDNIGEYLFKKKESQNENKTPQKPFPTNSSTFSHTTNTKEAIENSFDSNISRHKKYESKDTYGSVSTQNSETYQPASLSIGGFQHRSQTTGKSEYNSINKTSHVVLLENENQSKSNFCEEDGVKFVCISNEDFKEIANFLCKNKQKTQIKSKKPKKPKKSDTKQSEDIIYICIKLSVLKSELHCKNNRNLGDMLLVLSYVWKFRVIIYSDNYLEEQIKIFNELPCDFSIFGQIILIKDPNEVAKTDYDNSTSRKVYYLREDMKNWHDVLGVKMSNLYVVFDKSNNIIVYNSYENKILAPNLFDALKEVYEIEFKRKETQTQYEHFEESISLMRDQSNFELIGPDSRVTGSSASIQLFKEYSHPNRLFVGKVSLEGIGLDRYFVNEFNEYKEMFGLIFYRAYGVSVPENCLSYQLPNQSLSKVYADNNSIPKLHIMTEYLESYIQLGEEFIEKYKGNKNYFYYLESLGSGPLLGFGRALVTALVLNDIDCVGNTGKNMGFARRKGFLQLTKIDAGEILPDREYQAEKLYNSGETNEILLSTSGIKISFEELCQNDKMEFLTTLQKMMKGEKIEESIWEAFSQTDYKDKFMRIKEEIERRKKIIFKTFAKEMYKKPIGISAADEIHINMLHSDKFHNQLKDSVLTLQLEYLQFELKSENSQKINSLIKLLQIVFKFKIYIASKVNRNESKKIRNKAIKELEKYIQIDGEIMMDDEFKNTHDFSKSKNWYVGKFKPNKKYWHNYLGIGKDNLYSIAKLAKSIDMFRKGMHENGINMLEAIEITLKDQIASKIELAQKFVLQDNSPIFWSADRFTAFEIKQTPFIDSLNKIIFIDIFNQELFIGKSSETNKNCQDQQINEFIAYQEILRFKMYSIFGIITPHHCVSDITIKQDSIFYLMIQHIKGFQPFGELFLSKYKTNQQYYYYPESESDGPLIGFGSALLISYLLNNFNTLGDIGQHMGYIKRNGYCELVKIDSILTSQTIITQMTDSYGVRDDSAFIISTNGRAISFEDLCEYDKHEFMTIANRLGSSVFIEQKIWDQFENIICKDKLDFMKEQWSNRKQFIFQAFSIQHNKSTNSSFQSIKYPRHKAICVQLVLLENAFKDGRAQDLMSMFVLLKQLLRFRVYVVSEKEESHQDKIIEQLNLRFTITAQVITVNDPHFTQKKFFNTIKCRYIYKMTSNMRKICEGLNIFKNDIYYIYSSANGVNVFNKNECKEFSTITSVVRRIFESQQTARCKILQQQSIEPVQPCNILIRNTEDFIYLGADSNIVGQSPCIQKFFEIEESNRVFVGKISKEGVNIENEEKNSFEMYKTALGLKIYSMFNINVPYCCLSYQLQLQNTAISSNKTKRLHLMTHYLIDFKPFGLEFLQQYKTSKTYFYYPKSVKDGPLIGFGAALAIAHILKDDEWLDRSISTVGYIKMNGYLQFTKIDAHEIFKSQKKKQQYQLNPRGGTQIPILTNENTQIYYSDLCEYDRFEFAVVVGMLINSDSIENIVWNQFMSSPHVNKFGLLKDEWASRKNAFLKYFMGVIKSRLEGDLTIKFSQDKNSEGKQKRDSMSDFEKFIFSKYDEKRFFTTDTIYIVIEEQFLGSGAFGNVYEGYLRDDPTVKIAIKRIFNENHKEPKLNAGKESANGLTKDDIDREMEALMDVRKLRSPFLVHYYGAQVAKIKGERVLELAMELCKGNLRYYLDAATHKNKQLSKFEGILVFCQIVEGVVMLHKHNITHRDLKPDNILYKKVVIDGEEVVMWKIGDFGLASRKTEMISIEGTPIYMAPEIGGGRKYTKAVDIWSLGLILHRLVFGSEYSNKNIKEYKLPNNAEIIDIEIKELLIKMMKIKPEERITIVKIQDVLKGREEYKTARRIIYWDDEIEKKRNEKKEANINEFDETENMEEVMKDLDIGTEWQEGGSYNKAFNLYEKALLNVKKVVVEESFEIYGVIYHHMGVALKSLGKYDEALTYYNRGLQILVRLYGDQHIKTTPFFHNIGNALYQLGKYEESLSYYNRRLSILVKQYGDQHIETAFTYGNIGNSLQSLGKYEEALTYHNRALSIKVKHYGEQHIKIASNYQGIGNTLAGLGKYEEALTYLNRALSVQIKHYGEQHVQIASTYQGIGGALAKLGKYEEALTYFNRALSIQVKQYGEQHVQIASTYQGIGNALAKLGKYEEAFTYLNRALSVQIKHYGDQHDNMASIYNNIGGTISKLGKHEEALTYFNRALSIQVKQYGNQHIETASTYNNIGVTLQSLGKYEEALTYCNRALSIQVKQYGEEHTKTASTYANIGGTLQSLGKYEEALTYHNRALSIQVKQYGDQHIETASTYANIGATLQSLGKYEEALTYLNRALSTFVKHYGEQHDKMASIYNNIGGTISKLGKHEEALTYYNRALSIEVKQYGEQHVQTATTNANIGSALIEIGKHEEALTYLNPALSILAKHYGKQHIQTAPAYTNIGCALQSLGMYEEALTYYNCALSIQVKQYGEQKNIQTASTYANIGNIMSKLGKYEEALIYYNNALSIQLKHYGDQHIETALTYQDIGSVLLELGKYEQALTYLDRALSIQTKHSRGHHMKTASIYVNIGSALQSLGKYEEALTYCNRALSIQTNQYGEQHVQVAPTYVNIGVALQSLGKYEEAFKYLSNALSIFVKNYGEQHGKMVSIYDNIGMILGSLGKVEDALKYLNRALFIQIKLYGEKHIENSYLYRNIGAGLADLDKYEEALKYYNRALSIFVQNFGEQHVETAFTYRNIGIVMVELGKYEEALTYYNRALSIQVKQYGEQHIQTALSYYRIGQVYAKYSKYKEASKFFNQSLPAFKRTYGQLHPDTINLFNTKILCKLKTDNCRIF